MDFRHPRPANNGISFNVGYWNVPPGGQIDFEVQALLSYTAPPILEAASLAPRLFWLGKATGVHTDNHGRQPQLHQAQQLLPYATANPNYNPYCNPAPTNTSPLTPNSHSKPAENVNGRIVREQLGTNCPGDYGSCDCCFGDCPRRRAAA